MAFSNKKIQEIIANARKANKLTQEEFGKELGVSRSVLGQIENGQIKPSVEFMTLFCQKFNISLDRILGIKSEKNTKHASPETMPNSMPNSMPNDYKRENKDRLSVVSEPSPTYGSKITVTVDEFGNDNIIMVDTKAAAGYPIRVLEPEFYTELPAFKLPGMYKNGIFRAFQVDGDSMIDTLDHGDWVICQFLEKLDDIREGYIHVVVTHEEVCVKRVMNRVKQRSKIHLMSDNEEYPMRDLDAADIKEIWLVKAKLGFNLRNRRQDVHRLLNGLQIEVHELTGRMQKLEDKLNKNSF